MLTDTHTHTHRIFDKMWTHQPTSMHMKISLVIVECVCKRVCYEIRGDWAQSIYESATASIDEIQIHDLHSIWTAILFFLFFFLERKKMETGKNKNLCDNRRTQEIISSTCGIVVLCVYDKNKPTHLVVFYFRACTLYLYCLLFFLLHSFLPSFCRHKR